MNVKVYWPLTFRHCSWATDFRGGSFNSDFLARCRYDDWAAQCTHTHTGLSFISHAPVRRNRKTKLKWNHQKNETVGNSQRNLRAARNELGQQTCCTEHSYAKKRNWSVYTVSSFF